MSFWNFFWNALGVTTPAPAVPAAIPKPVVVDPPKPPVKPVVVDKPKPTKDRYYAYRPMFDLLGKSEGTDRGAGYNETLAYGAYTGGAVNLVGMTLQEIDTLQTAMLRHKRNKWNSSAVGRYQIIRTTLRSLRGKLALGLHHKYDAELQDLLCLYLLNRRGLGKFLGGQMEQNAILLSLSKEWASLPTPRGKSFYGGQHSSVTTRDVLRALTQVSERLKG